VPDVVYRIQYCDIKHAPKLSSIDRSVAVLSEVRRDSVFDCLSNNELEITITLGLGFEKFQKQVMGPWMLHKNYPQMCQRVENLQYSRVPKLAFTGTLPGKQGQTAIQQGKEMRILEKSVSLCRGSPPRSEIVSSLKAMDDVPVKKLNLDQSMDAGAGPKLKKPIKKPKNLPKPPKSTSTKAAKQQEEDKEETEEASQQLSENVRGSGKKSIAASHRRIVDSDDDEDDWLNEMVAKGKTPVKAPPKDDEEEEAEEEEEPQEQTPPPKSPMRRSTRNSAQPVRANKKPASARQVDMDAATEDEDETEPLKLTKTDTDDFDASQPEPMASEDEESDEAVEEKETQRRSSRRGGSPAPQPIADEESDEPEEDAMEAVADEEAELLSKSAIEKMTIQAIKDRLTDLGHSYAGLKLKKHYVECLLEAQSTAKMDAASEDSEEEDEAESDADPDDGVARSAKARSKSNTQPASASNSRGRSESRGRSQSRTASRGRCRGASEVPSKVLHAAAHHHLLCRCVRILM